MSPAWYKRLMIQVAEHYGIPTRTPFDLLDEDHRDILLHGSGSTVITSTLNRTTAQSTR